MCVIFLYSFPSEDGHPAGYWIGLEYTAGQWTWNNGTPVDSTYWGLPPTTIHNRAKLFTPTPIWVPSNENGEAATICVYKDPTTPTSSPMLSTQSVPRVTGKGRDIVYIYLSVGITSLFECSPLFSDFRVATIFTDVGLNLRVIGY